MTDLTARDLSNRRDALVARVREDYTVELGQLVQESGVRSQESVNPEETQDEIDYWVPRELQDVYGNSPASVLVFLHAALR